MFQLPIWSESALFAAHCLRFCRHPQQYHARPTELKDSTLGRMFEPHTPSTFSQRFTAWILINEHVLHLRELCTFAMGWSVYSLLGVSNTKTITRHENITTYHNGTSVPLFMQWEQEASSAWTFLACSRNPLSVITPPQQDLTQISRSNAYPSFIAQQLRWRPTSHVSCTLCEQTTSSVFFASKMVTCICKLQVLDLGNRLIWEHMEAKEVRYSSNTVGCWSGSSCHIARHQVENLKV
jgi:hypothetical protein